MESEHTELFLCVANTAAVATRDEEDRMWFVDMTARAARVLNVETLEDFEESLSRWLYVVEMQRGEMVAVMRGLVKEDNGKGKGRERERGGE